MSKIVAVVALLMALALTREAVALGRLPLFQQSLRSPNASASAETNLGRAVAITPDGTRIIAGTLGYGTSFVAVFERSGSSWTQIACLSGPTNSVLGRTDIALSSNGNTVAVSDPYFPDVLGKPYGAVFLFQANNTEWATHSMLRTTTPQQNSRIGRGLTISGDGQTVASRIVTVPSQGICAMIIWVNNASGWQVQTENLTSPDLSSVGSVRTGFGIRNGLALDGNTLATANSDDDSNAGGIAIFKRSGIIWAQFGSKLTVSGSSNLGLSLELSGDGKIVVATESNGLYIFEYSPIGDAYALLQNLAKPQTASSYFGNTNGDPLALSNSGNRLIVGDPKINQGLTGTLGGAFIYDRKNGVSFTLVPGNITTNNSASAQNDSSTSFGYAVAVSDDNHFVLGGPSSYSSEGSLIVFVSPSTSAPTLSPTTRAPTSNSDATLKVRAFDGLFVMWLIVSFLLL